MKMRESRMRENFTYGSRRGVVAFNAPPLLYHYDSVAALSDNAGAVVER